MLVLGLLALVTASTQAGHRLEPSQVELGQTSLYVVELGPGPSVAAMAATTVHAPAGDGVQVGPRSMHLEVGAEGVVRRDTFPLRALAAGEHEIRPAIVEVPGETMELDAALQLKVRAPGGGLGPGGLAALGALMVLGALGLTRRRVEAVAEAGGAAPAGVAGDPLEPLREARTRGDVRDFYVRLHALLRERVRQVSGRSPRDPRGLATAARQAGLGRVHADQLRYLAQLCERVSFGGERPSPSTMAPSQESAEGILAGLGRLDSNAGGSAPPRDEDRAGDGAR